MKHGIYKITALNAGGSTSCSLAVSESSGHKDRHNYGATADLQEQKKLPYPRSVLTLLGSTFFERISLNGMKTVLIIYLTTQLAFDTDQATMIYHSYMTLAFFAAIVGAIISDSWLGKYQTILAMYAFGMCGMVLLNLGTFHPLRLPERELTLLALVVLALGTGSMKPCILAFGGDQFRVPEQLHLMSAYFSLVFFVLKISALVGTALTPMLRTQMNCFGQDSCYLLVFGVCGCVLMASMVCFVAGKRQYVMQPSSGNIIVQVFKCIGRALINRMRTKKPTDAPSTHKHWLDYAAPHSDAQLIHDTRSLLNVLVLYIPIPFYWALNEQTGSRWTLQATRMVGDVFDGAYSIKPDQMQIVMQVLLIAFIPLFETVLYPVLGRVGLRRPLQKIALAMALAGAAFVVAGYVESHVARDYARLPTAAECQLRVYNAQPHPVHVRRRSTGETTVIGGMDAVQLTVSLDRFNFSGPAAATDFELHAAANATTGIERPALALPVVAGTAVSYLFEGDGVLRAFEDSARKATSQRPRLRVLVVNPADAGNSTAVAGSGGDPATLLTLYDQVGRYVRYRRRSTDGEQFELAATRFTVRIGGELVTDRLALARGSVSTLLVRRRPAGDWDVGLVELTRPNGVHMLWMLPQYTLLAAGEAIIGVTGMFFAYSEAPETMKTVLQACWLLTIALGHLIDVVVVGANFIDSQTVEYYAFAGLMFANIMLFTWLVRRYQPLARDSSVSAVLTTPDINSTMTRPDNAPKTSSSAALKNHRV